MTKVFLWPLLSAASKANGIGRIVHAQHEFLPKHGVELVANPLDADVCAVHTQKGTSPRVDVLHCHGLYFDDLEHVPYATWHRHANHGIVQAAREALAITVPSNWVAEPFRRDMWLEPTIIGHGVELDAWDPLPNAGYVLWNKNRRTDVCDPTAAAYLGDKGAHVVTTFLPEGHPAPANVSVIGQLPWDKMRDVIRAADVYLSTTCETFGVGTLEAMAAGVPVLGWNWGGTADLVRHEVDGILLPPGDWEGLLRGLEHVRVHRRQMSMAARERAREFGWDRVMSQYADLYQRVAGGVEREKAAPRISVIIPTHNYAQYLPRAVRSVLDQTIPAEIIVVDDASQDATPTIMAKIQADHPGRVQYLRNETNRGVAFTRNRGIQESTGELLVCLDADDYLDKQYLHVCSHKMRQQRDLGVTYTGLMIIRDNGTFYRTQWPPEFSWESQSTAHVPPSNCIPSAAMFRRAMWERAGGYRQKYAPGEDAEFWTRGLSLGWKAERVSDSPLFFYQVHQGSASRSLKYIPIDEFSPWMRDRRFPMAAPTPEPPVTVMSYHRPLISVMVLHPSSGDKLWNTLNSVLGQHWRHWELWVEGDPIREAWLSSFPWVHWAGSRRLAECARAPWIFHMNAGDMIPPGALADAIRSELSTVKNGHRVQYPLQENKAMGCCGGGDKVIMQAKKILGLVDAPMSNIPDAAIRTGNGSLRLEFVGVQTGSVTFRGKGGRIYRGGNNTLDKYVNADPEDAGALLSTGVWKPVLQQLLVEQ
jgi:hypothetical protein